MTCYEKRQPVLAGTVSIEKIEERVQNCIDAGRDSASGFEREKPEQEAFIIAQQGVPVTVTIATNMADAGQYIMLAAIRHILHGGMKGFGIPRTYSS